MGDKNKTFLIFEDDSQIPPDFHKKLKQALDHVPDDWDFLYLNHNLLRGWLVGDRFWLKPDPERSVHAATNALANAYMLRPLGAARLLKFQHPISFLWSNDANMRQHFLDFTAYFLVENLVPTAHVSSVRLSGG